MKRVKSIDDIVKFEKKIAKKYDADFDEYVYRSQLKSLFEKHNIDENDFRGFVYEENDVDCIDDEEFMIIEIDDVFKKVYASWRAWDVRFTIFD